MKEDALSSFGLVKMLCIQPETCGGGERGNSPALFWHAVIGLFPHCLSLWLWDPPPTCVRPTQGFPCSNLNICMYSGFLMNNSAVAGTSPETLWDEREVYQKRLLTGVLRRGNICWISPVLRSSYHPSSVGFLTMSEIRGKRGRRGRRRGGDGPFHLVCDITCEVDRGWEGRLQLNGYILHMCSSSCLLMSVGALALGIDTTLT